jgi:hypothetical protein
MELKKIYSEKFASYLIIFGITVIFISILLFIYKTTFDFSSPIDSNKFSQFGDFIGGLIGPLWALAGVILFYLALKLQTKQLNLQQDEIKQQRNQFELNRLTEITFKQIEHFNNTFNSLKYKYPDSNSNEVELNSDQIFALIHNHMSKYVDKKLYDEETEEINGENKLNESIEFFGGVLKYFLHNKEQMLILFSTLKRCVSVLRLTYIKENIQHSELNELKSIFFKNIGEDFLQTSILLSSMIEAYLSLLRKSGEKISPYDPLDTIERSISIIKEFKETIYDEDSIAQYRKDRAMYMQL